MLREDRKASFATAGLLGRRRRFESGAAVAPLAISRRGLRRLIERSAREPVELLQRDRERWWMCRGRVYREDEGYAAEDVLALVAERDRRKQRRLEQARVTLRNERNDGRSARTAIPHEIKLAVWERDRGRCVECGTSALLEFDHVIPLALGGSNSERNLQILCADCNRRKSDSL